MLKFMSETSASSTCLLVSEMTLFTGSYRSFLLSLGSSTQKKIAQQQKKKKGSISLYLSLVN